MATRCVPDVGHLFRYDGSKLRVVAWLRSVETDEDEPEKLQFCTREQAEFVQAVGDLGTVIVALESVSVRGRVDWTPEMIEQERQEALKLVGQFIQ